MQDFQYNLIGQWVSQYEQELALIPDLKELFQNTSQDNFSFTCQEIGFGAVFSLMNSGNTTSLRNTLINQVQEAGITTLQQRKNWLIDWYFSNDPMGSIYLATLRNSALVSTYQTNPGMLYGTPYATGMENYFQKIKNYFGQSMFDQLVTEFAQQSNLYVDEIKVDEFHLYSSNRLGVYEANKTISRRVARDLNNDKQISNNEYIVETPEEVLYLYSSYQLERGAKRYELANHLGNVLTVISDKKTANFTGTTFTHFTAERISATDYSPFGAPLAGRTWQAQEYRYGFNGKELDSEGMGGGGSTYDYGFRIYNAQLGRFLSVDPLTASFPWYTPFQFAGNKPICSLDLDGLEDVYYLKPLINGKESLLLRVFKNSTVGKYILKAFENLTAKDPADIVVFESNLPTNLAGFTIRIPNHIIKSHLKGTTDNVNQILEKFGLDKDQKKELDLLFKTIVSKCENRDVFLVALRKNTTARSEGSFTLAAEGAFNLGHELKLHVIWDFEGKNTFDVHDKYQNEKLPDHWSQEYEYLKKDSEADIDKESYKNSAEDLKKKSVAKPEKNKK